MVDLTDLLCVGMMRLKFPSYVFDAADTGYDQSRRIAIILNGNQDSSTVVLPSDEGSTFDTVTITGVSTQNSGGVSPNFGHYFVASIYTGDNGDVPITSVTQSSASSSSATVDLNPLEAANDHVTIRVATSLISLDQAILNLKAEVSTSVSFDVLTAEAKKEWNTVLSRAKLNDVGSGYTEQQTSDYLTTFYSSLYRASLFPRQLTETDASGKLVHWSPFDGAGNVYDGSLTTDSGFWDAYNTVYPYLSLINRKVLGTMMDGWVSGYK
jgi:putative alpha-1,2-mannosidase